MQEQIYISSRVAVESASDLISRFGEDAGMEAAARAERSRDLGNLHHFCHWRQIERIVLLLANDESFGTLH
jgi:hypothetical protein